MSETIWQVWVKEEDYWTRIQWAPTFNTQKEADDWVAQNNDKLDSSVKVMDITVTDEGWFTTNKEN